MIAEPAAPTFGKFTPDADEEIDRAADKYGIDPDFLKAIIATESSGDWERNNRCVKVGGWWILPYAGLSYAVEPDPKYVQDRAMQIDVAAHRIAEWKRQAEEDVYAVVAQTWFAGPPRDTWSSSVEFANKVMGWTRNLRKQR